MSKFFIFQLQNKSLRNQRLSQSHISQLRNEVVIEFEGNEPLVWIDGQDRLFSLLINKKFFVLFIDGCHKTKVNKQ